MLAAIVPCPHPRLRVRLALQDVAGLDEGLAKAELIVAGATGKTRITRGVRSVGLQHDLCFHPRLVGSMIRIHPVVDKNKLAVGFRLVSQAVLGPGSRSLKRDLL